jgi:hydroxymethylglutaryl-CoA lyase
VSDEVCIYEVGPRDGLQNEAQILPTEQKVELIERLVDTGLRRIEVTSFVSPEWIPQLADADALAPLLPVRSGLRLSALVPNERGYARFARATSIDTAAIFISVSETHNQKNVNCSVAEHLERLRGVTERCAADDVPVRAYVSTAFGCAHEGAIAPKRVAALAHALVALGADEISLGDTVGLGHPALVREVLQAVAEVAPLACLGLHLHDTYGRALANLQAGYEFGVRTFDSALGGLGGCPYAPGAAGNVATEDVVGLFDAAGIETGVRLDGLVDTGEWLESEVLERPLSSRVYRAKQGERLRA